MRISDWSSDVCSSDLLVQQCLAARWHRAPSDRADHAIRVILEGLQVWRLDDPCCLSGPAGSDQAGGQAGAELQPGKGRHVRDWLQVTAFCTAAAGKCSGILHGLQRYQIGSTTCREKE